MKPKSLPPGSRTRAALILILALGASLRLIHFFSIHDSLILLPRGFLDDAYYFRLAQQVAQGDLLAGTGPFFLAPLYIYFLGLVYALFSPGLAAPFLIQIAGGVLTILLIYRCATLTLSPAAGLLAALLFALDGMAAMYECTLLPAAFDPLFFAFLLYAALVALHSEKAVHFALAGAAAGLCALNRPNALVLVVIVALLPLRRLGRRGLATALLVLAAAGAVIAPFTIRNYLASRDLVLISSHGGLNFYEGNGRDATGFYRSPPWLAPDVRGQEEDTVAYLSNLHQRPVRAGETSGLLYRLAGREIRADVPAWLALMGRKTLYLLNGREAGLNLSLAYLRELSPGLWLLPVGMWLLLPLALLGAAAERKNPAARLLVLVSAAYGATVVMFFIADRYRLPLSVPLAILGGVGLERLFTALREGSRREAARLAAAMLPAILLAALPLEIPSGRGSMRLLYALRLIEDNRIEEARAVAADMPKGELNPFAWRDRLAQAYAAKGDFADAAEQYRLLVAMAPDYGPLHCQLGSIYLAAKKYPEAKAELSRGVALSPHDQPCRDALAAAQAESSP